MEEKKEIHNSILESYESMMQEVLDSIANESERKREIIPLVAMKEFHKSMVKDQRLLQMSEALGVNYYHELNEAFMAVFNKYIII